MTAFLNGAAFVINYIIDMGASVMLPIIIGVKVGKAVRSGLMIGVGFVGMSLIVDMMNANMGPAAKAMAERLGVSLSIVEVGWPGMSGVTWGSVVATIAIPLAIAVNLVMFAAKLTKTINIDIWNIWHMAFTGALAYAVTENLWIGLLGVAVHAIFAYKFGDLWAPLANDYFGLENLTVPHGTATYMAPIACLVDALIEKIPGLNKVNISIESLQEKIGVLGEPVVSVAILGGGTIGMFVMQWARIFGAKDAVVFDIAPERLELGKRLGATAGINTLESDFMDKAMTLTNGRGFDYVFETAGNTITMKMAFKLAANKASVCFVGTPTKDLSFSVEEWENMNRKEFTLTGSWMSYSAPFPGREWELVAHYFKTGGLKFDSSFIFQKTPLSKIADAFALYETPGAVKGKILIDSEQ